MIASSGCGEPLNNPLQHWYLCQEYTIVEAALLIAGHDPGTYEDVEQLARAEQPRGYTAAKNALVQRLFTWEFGKRVSLKGASEDQIDVHRSIVYFWSVRDWLAKEGKTTGFFFEKEQVPSAGVPDYLNQNHPRYAPELAAAVKAWEAVREDEAEKSTRSPKAMLWDWLERHAEKFELTLPDGKLNRSGIERVSTVANWRREGGAPKTLAKKG
jgi:hypothetical protein